MREKTVSILDRLFWSVQPPKGLIKGDYYHEEMRFSPSYEGAPGHLGSIDVVAVNGDIAMVEFHELCSPTYYIKLYQNVDKRLSSYNFFQASKERTALTGVVLANGFSSLEQQMVEENRLTGDFRLVTGASNSINRCMLPLAERAASRMDAPSGQLYYGLSREIEPGVTGRLQVVMEGDFIQDISYDEIFADRPEEILNPEYKPYYRQSKYHCLEYCSSKGPGFNALADVLASQILKNQNLMDLTGLPFTEPDSAVPEWGNYLSLAAIIVSELKSDHIIES